jgi:hypothetical protein
VEDPDGIHRHHARHFRGESHAVADRAVGHAPTLPRRRARKNDEFAGITRMGDAVG